MKIKKQIKKYLIEQIGVDKCNILFDKQEKMFNELIKNTKNKSENQMKTLVQTILPRIASYKGLLKEGISEEESYKYI
jgi:polyhydroxyalkanoate synthesis regulator phasin